MQALFLWQVVQITHVFPHFRLHHLTRFTFPARSPWPATRTSPRSPLIRGRPACQSGTSATGGTPAAPARTRPSRSSRRAAPALVHRATTAKTAETTSMPTGTNHSHARSANIVNPSGRPLIVHLPSPNPSSCFPFLLPQQKTPASLGRRASVVPPTFSLPQPAHPEVSKGREGLIRR